MTIEKKSFKLGELGNPARFNDPVKIETISHEVAISALHEMLKIRLVENKIALGRRDGLILGPVHLGVGQEAVAVGVSKNLKKSDRVFGAHRSHSHVLALGSSIYKLFSEILGRQTGLSNGMGGSMHLWDKPNGFYGSVPIVAGTVALAVGAGLAAKMQKTGDVGVVYLGDGAIEEGIVHESFNLAKIYNVPVIFIVENNLFSSHMHISMRQPLDSVARFAAANDIAHVTIDGNNFIEVYRAASDSTKMARSGQGPSLIEAVTFRWFGHVDWREDIDVGVNRSENEIILWKNRDPVERLKNGLIEDGIWSEEAHQKLSAELESNIDAAWELAINSPYPEPADIINYVYSRD